ARDMIRLSGLEVGRDIAIVFSGLRPGEKLFEELFISGEEYQSTRHEKIFIASNASTFVPERLESYIHALALAAEHNDRTAILRGLHDLVPEFMPLEEANKESSTALGSLPDRASAVNSTPSSRPHSSA
ncbi:MAG TPA: polysaccharide biosynthesis protein, partial [Roseiflexaceae bacterium]|nr:polysaccharide biosynthesis protein [Roseiflexaceae bacterium]